MKKIFVCSAVILFISLSLIYLAYNELKLSSRVKINDKNVVFILIDTLRADFVSAYGYQKDTTPFIDQLASSGIIFEKAIAASSWTAPSVASLFTSEYPTEHGVITGMVVRRRLKEQHHSATFNRISEEKFTLPEFFHSNGYQTIGVADNLNISEALGFSQGFDYFKTLHDKTAEEVNKKASEFLKSRDSSKPTFLYLHYMDPHAPYSKRSPWYKKGKNKEEDIIRRYRSEVSYVDSKIKELFDQHPFLKDSIVVITADHGEQFWEHGKRGHGKSLHREEIHVPLIIHHPDLKDKIKITRTVSSIDILPTLADLKDQKRYPEWKGVSMVSILDENKPARRGAFSELFFHELLKHQESFHSLVKSSEHTIKKIAPEPEYKLYDWDNDKLEKNGQVLARNSGQVENLENFVNDMHGSNHDKVDIELNEEAIKQLKTLGYVQ